MRIAYLLTQYPKVSHTFIRRELLEIERQGHFVLRLSIRKADAPPVDPQDHAEQRKTLCCLSQPLGRLLAGQVLTALTRPVACARALALALRMGWRSDTGLLRHLAYFAEAAYLSQILRANRIEHVHAHFGSNAATVARLLRRLGGPTYSFTVHGTDLFDAPRSLDVRGKLADATFAVAVCDYSAAQLRRWGALEDWPKVRVVRCAVGDEYFAAAQPIDPRANTLVCVGRLSPEKGHLLLIDAFAELVRSGTDARLVLVGDGDLRPAVERRVAERGLTERVTLAGYLSETGVREQLLAARALVLPSFSEGLPMVIMEAFALGRPVISTYVAGIPELVRPGENGWLVPAGNVARLAEAMHEAICTPVERLHEMGAAGQKSVREQHSLAGEVAKLNALFSMQAQRAGSPASMQHGSRAPARDVALPAD